MGDPSAGPALKGRVHIMSEGFKSAGKPLKVEIHPGETPGTKPYIVTPGRHGDFAIHLPAGKYCIKVGTSGGCADEERPQCEEVVNHPKDGTIRFAHYAKYCDG